MGVLTRMAIGIKAKLKDKKEDKRTRGNGEQDEEDKIGNKTCYFYAIKSTICSHCERSEAIQGPKERFVLLLLDCFVAYTPRNDCIYLFLL